MSTNLYEYVTHLSHFLGIFKVQHAPESLPDVELRVITRWIKVVLGTGIEGGL